MRIGIICTTCNSLYRLGNNEDDDCIRCKKCGHVIEIEKMPAEEIMPDFNSLFTALAEQERLVPTLEYNRIGASS